jgi:hypothetical protein
MIDFRYHIVSVVSVFLALALGLFLGSTTLQGAVFNDLDKRTKGVASENRRLEQQATDLHAQISGDKAFANAVEPYAVAGRLSGQTVVVVSAPGADGSARKRLLQTLTDAGATVTADIRLRDTFVDPRQDALLGSLAGRLATSSLPQGTGMAKAAAELASVLVSKPGRRSPSDEQLATSLSAYSDGSLLQVAGDTPHPGNLAVVLGAAPPANATSEQEAPVNAAVMLIAQALDRNSAGVVLGGPIAAASPPGVLATARSSSSFTAAVSTVDGLDTTAGTVATVFALTEQIAGRSGSYGSATGASAALPAPSSAP